MRVWVSRVSRLLVNHLFQTDEHHQLVRSCTAVEINRRSFPLQRFKCCFRETERQITASLSASVVAPVTEIIEESQLYLQSLLFRCQLQQQRYDRQQQTGPEAAALNTTWKSISDRWRWGSGENIKLIFMTFLILICIYFMDCMQEVNVATATSPAASAFSPLLF